MIILINDEIILSLTAEFNLSLIISYWGEIGC